MCMCVCVLNMCLTEVYINILKWCDWCPLSDQLNIELMQLCWSDGWTVPRNAQAGAQCPARHVVDLQWRESRGVNNGDMCCTSMGYRYVGNTPIERKDHFDEITFTMCTGSCHFVYVWLTILKVTTYAPPFRPLFFRSLENLYSFDPYILAKMKKMSYFDRYFSSKLDKMYSFDPPFFDPRSVSSQRAVLSIPIRNPTN